MAYLAIGVDLEGRKYALGCWIHDTEGAEFWQKVAIDLRNRGVHDILIACCNGSTGLPDAIRAIYPDTVVQTCVVHVIRNAARCHRAAIEGHWATTMRFFAGPGLLVIDELGHLPLPAEAASALFQIVSQRYLKTSILIITTRGVRAWGEILGDTTVAAPMLDRLPHRSIVVNPDGESYRLRDHHAAAETLRRATIGTRQPPPTGGEFQPAGVRRPKSIPRQD